MTVLLKPNVPCLWPWHLIYQDEIVFVNYMTMTPICVEHLDLYQCGEWADSSLSNLDTNFKFLLILTLAWHQNYKRYKNGCKPLKEQWLPPQNGLRCVKISSKIAKIGHKISGFPHCSGSGSLCLTFQHSTYGMIVSYDAWMYEI